jgi:dGTPase
VGEEVLNELYPKGFRHNEQSLRVVDCLEKDGKGLNLTWEVREGILKHSKSSKQDILGDMWDPPTTLEAQICRIADSVAYINHDIGDAIRAGLITEDDLPQSAIVVLGKSHSKRIDTMVCDIIDQSWSATGIDDTKKTPIITMSHEVLEAANHLRQFLFQRVYEVQIARKETERAIQVVRFLYYYFVNNPDKLPREFATSDEAERGVVDYIAGMTDNYALSLASELGALTSNY